MLYVLLPPLLWSAGWRAATWRCGATSGRSGCSRSGLPLATTFAVGFVAYKTVPELTVAAALTLGAIVAPPDAVSATAIGRRLGLPRRVMTLLGGESLLNDATALTAYKVSLAAAIGTAATLGQRPRRRSRWRPSAGSRWVSALGFVISFIRWRLDDPLVESAIGLVAPFVIYLAAEEIHGSGVLAVVVAALILGQHSTQAGYATRLQDTAVWKAVQLVLESFAFLMIGLQLPTVVGELKGIPRQVIVDLVGRGVGDGDRGPDRLGLPVRVSAAGALQGASASASPQPTPAQVFVVAWAGMRGVVSLAAAFGVPMTTLSGAPFPGRPQLVFLTFVVVIGTLLLHGLTLPWLIRRLGVQGDEARTDAIAAAAAQDKAARAAADRLDELLAEEAGHRCARAGRRVLRGWNTRRRNAGVGAAGPRRGGDRREPRAAFRRLRLEMLAAERETFIAERDSGQIDDEVLRAVLRGLDLEEATLNRYSRARVRRRKVRIAIDHRGEHPMRGGKILVGHVGQGRVVCSASGVKKPRATAIPWSANRRMTLRRSAGSDSRRR